MKQSLNVHIGEVKTGRDDQQLHTILGSCVGIGFLWAKHGSFGLAHCLLPFAPEREPQGGGRYVDQAIHTLLESMNVTHTRDIRAVVAGGANMTLPDTKTPEKLIGFQNARAAIDTLYKMKIRVVHEDTGGFEGRKMSICCLTGLFEVRAIPRLAP